MSDISFIKVYLTGFRAITMTFFIIFVYTM